MRCDISRKLPFLLTIDSFSNWRREDEDEEEKKRRNNNETSVADESYNGATNCPERNLLLLVLPRIISPKKPTNPANRAVLLIEFYIYESEKKNL